MENSKIVLLAEVSILPEFLQEVKALSAATLVPTLKEPGCEVFYQTSKKDDPNTLVFFEVFTSQEALDTHLQADYTKAFFAGLPGKVSGKPVTTMLHQL
jgi:quinol monooxygenase YgiN